MMKPNFWLATFVGVALTLASAALGQTVQIADLQPGRIVGTVTDINNDTIPDAIVVLDGSATTDQRRIATDENGYFEFVDVKAGAPYRVSIHAEGFADWTSPAVVLEPGQCKIMTDIQLRIAMAVTTVQVTYDPVRVATEQVKMQEKQRVLGFIPNFYVVYDRDPAPMTAKLKFQLAFKVVVDPVTATGIAFYSGIEQAGDRPNYGQGAQGFGKRVGANAAGGFTDIMIGGAILPSLLHQDPPYFIRAQAQPCLECVMRCLDPLFVREMTGNGSPTIPALEAIWDRLLFPMLTFRSLMVVWQWCLRILRSILENASSQASLRSSFWADLPIEPVFQNSRSPLRSAHCQITGALIDEII